MAIEIDRAGMIPYYINADGDIEMLFVIPTPGSNNGHLPQIAKGKIQKDETELQAAVRECQEETGLFVPNIVGKPFKVGRIMNVVVFAAEIKDKDKFGVPSNPKEIAKVVWMTPTEFQHNGRLLHRPIVTHASNKIVARHQKHKNRKQRSK